MNAFETIMLDNNGHNYIESFYGYGLFALLKEWWIRDFKESSEELKIILEDIIQHY